MLRERILDALGELRLGGMKSAYDELMAGVRSGDTVRRSFCGLFWRPK